MRANQMTPGAFSLALLVPAANARNQMTPTTPEPKRLARSLEHSKPESWGAWRSERFLISGAPSEANASAFAQPGVDLSAFA